MPRLRSVRTGAVVSCSEETAARLDSEWQPADQDSDQTAGRKTPAKRTAARKAADTSESTADSD